MSIELVIPSNHLILCHPLFLLPSIFPSNRVFSNESVLHISWPKYWRFNFRIGPSNEYSGLISFRVIEWISLQSKGHLKESCPTSEFKTINCSSLIILYGATVASIHDNWKNHSFDYNEIFSTVMSLLLKNLYRFVIVFLQMSKHLLISWLQSSSVVILEPLEIKSFTVSINFPSICHEVMEPNAMILIF